MTDQHNIIEDGKVLNDVTNRAMQKGSTLLSESECDAIERWVIAYAGARGVNIKPNPTPKPWAGAKGEEP